jgi:hypothetical protein
LQRQFLTFLEDMELREETVPNGRGEVVFYNLGKFSQLISDFETIHYHSKPDAKYEAFCGFLQYRAESAYPEAGRQPVRESRCCPHHDSPPGKRHAVACGLYSRAGQKPVSLP